MNDILYIIIPCYNEEEVLPITSEVFLKKLISLIDSGKINDESRIMFVDDGSRDKTWEVIEKLAKSDRHFTGVRQSRNRGHQNALLCGLMEAKEKCDITVSIDCDGQDDINAIDEMIKEYENGCEIVYGVRDNRESDSFFKRNTAQTFYKMINKMGCELVYNHADYRLVSSRVLKEFSKFEEVNLFLRGMFPMVGFKSTSVYYKRNKRVAGKSKYPLKKMLALAVDGITSLSIKPLRMVTALGMIFSAFSFAGVMWAIITQVLGHSVAGWASIVCVICFMGGIQLIGIGILGEYIGKIYLEVKHRPRYIVSERTEDDK